MSKHILNQQARPICGTQAQGDGADCRRCQRIAAQRKALREWRDRVADPFGLRQAPARPGGAAETRIREEAASRITATTVDNGIGAYECHGFRGHDSRPALELDCDEVRIPLGDGLRPGSLPEDLTGTLEQDGLGLEYRLSLRGVEDGAAVYSVDYA